MQKRPNPASDVLSETKRLALAEEFGLHMQQALAEGADPLQVIAQRALEYMALAKVLAPTGDFAQLLTDILTSSLRAQQADASTQIAADKVMMGVATMLVTCRHIAIASADLLCDPAFIGSLPDAVKGIAFGLNHHKVAHIARQLAQTETPAAAKLPIHIAGLEMDTASQRRLLADIFEPLNGPLAEPLAAAIQQIMPELPAARCVGVARGWLYEQHQSVTDAPPRPLVAPEGSDNPS